MKNSLISLVLIVIVSVVVLAGCAKPSPATAPAPAPTQQIPIGIGSPLTGTMAFLGSQMSNAILMAIDDQNAKGGITIGGQKYMLNPILRDTKGDLVVAKSVAEELVFDKKVNVIGGPFIADAVGIQYITEKNKVFMFATTAVIPGMTSPSKPFSFFCTAAAPDMAYRPLAYVKSRFPQLKTVYSFEADVADLPIFAANETNCCKLLDLTYLGYEKVSIDTRDFTPNITRVLSHNPDIIDTGTIGGVMGGLNAVMVKQIGQAGFKGPIVETAPPPEDVMQETVPPEILDQVIVANPNVDSTLVTPAYRDLMARFNAKYQMKGIDIVACYYNVMMAFFDFLNTQNTMDTTTWMQGFAKYHWQSSLFGMESLWIGEPADGINRRVLGNRWVSHYENGKPITDFSAPIPWELFVKPSP
jgi:branched-chain amino acid transport system substrate-binding protein